jgi:hypothetical protein
MQLTCTTSMQKIDQQLHDLPCVIYGTTFNMVWDLKFHSGVTNVQ